MMQAAFHLTIHDIDAADWNRCFAGDPEAWAYYAAVEESALPGFTWFYASVRRDEAVVLVVPGFVTEYRLDTTIQGGLKRLLAPLAPLLRHSLACLGSPAADKCHLGLTPDLSEADREQAIKALLAGFDAFAKGRRIGFMAVKDLAEEDATPAVLEIFARAGYCRQPSLPNALLSLDGFADEDSYLASLSRSTRKDIRRKLKGEGRVRIEWRSGAEALDMVETITALYDRQRARSGVDFEQFEQLTPAYFANVLTRLGDRALVALYWHEDQLAGFNLCLEGERLFIDKFIGLEDRLARELDLYAVSWMANVRRCLARGIPVLQTGQTAYRLKVRLGSRLMPNWLLFRHRWGLINRILHAAGPLLAADRWDQELEGGQ
jgi:hypothetical protein